VRRVGGSGLLPLTIRRTGSPCGVPGGATAIGWIDGQNVRIDSRWGAGDADDIRKNAKEL